MVNIRRSWMSSLGILIPIFNSLSVKWIPRRRLARHHHETLSHYTIEFVNDGSVKERRLEEASFTGYPPASKGRPFKYMAWRNANLPTMCEKNPSMYFARISWRWHHSQREITLRQPVICKEESNVLFKLPQWRRYHTTHFLDVHSRCPIDIPLFAIRNLHPKLNSVIATFLPFLTHAVDLSNAAAESLIYSVEYQSWEILME